MFITDAYAQGAPAPAGGAFDPSSLILMVGIIAIFYFLLIRPQQKRAREHREMLANVKRGDKVITTGGIIGKITKVTDEQLIVEVEGGTTFPLVRDGIANVVDKTQPAKPKAKKDAEAEQAAKPKGLAGLLGGGKKADR